MSKLIDYLATLPQYLLPHHLLSRMMLFITRIRFIAFKNFFIETFIQLFDVDMNLANRSEPEDYLHFNDFFTRSLKSVVRPIEGDDTTLVSPVDGTISQIGSINDELVFQAKGHHYTLTSLLGGDSTLAAQFINGKFTTIYLSPRDYHRIHMPVAGKLKTMLHVPGRLFSVNSRTTRMVPDLFARNERVVSIFDTECGPMALIMVGAIFVGSMET
ncbi:MAG: archaetidylserine decarboxylase, partial [Gammaproteobacteria bacterium]|nr:archaetidylserine decarboxylase [Gammaproteobacteria bacterium]